MLTSEQLKKVTTEARPIIERMMGDADRLAGLRDVVSAAGGDWGQLKALIKAQIKDEQDEAGDGKHVRKILDKADYALGYADMLGLGNLNENNCFGDDDAADEAVDLAPHDLPDHDPATGEIIEPDHSSDLRNMVHEPAPAPAQLSNAADAGGATASVSPATHEGEHSTVSSPDYQREPLSVPAVSEPLPDADAQRSTAGPHPVANVGEGANAASAAASDDPASREVDVADRQRLASSGFSGDAAVAPQPSQQDGDGPAAGATAAPSTIIRFSSKPLRPHCLKTGPGEICGSPGGKVHCGPCEKARSQRMPVEAGGVEIEHRGNVS